MMMELYDLLSVEDRDERILEQIASDYVSGIPAIVYGNGDYANRVKRRLKTKNITPIFAVDKPYLQTENSGGGGAAIAVENLPYTDYNLILGMFEPPVDYVKKFPKARNIYNMYTILSEIFDTSLSQSMFKEKYELFDQTYKWLEDDISKDIMKEKLAVNISANLSANLGANLAALGSRCIKRQYFIDLFENGDFNSFIDCGAYKGDTFNSFISIMGQNFDRYIGFEPDIDNYVEFRKTVRQHGCMEKVTLINAGVSDINGKVRFSSNSLSSKISNDGEKEIDVVTIDETVKEESITFLKMDIEGNELSALHGAIETIKRDKPNLAICVYHKADDLITIPQFIKSVVPEYRIYLRHHTKLWPETVLYAKV